MTMRYVVTISTFLFAVLLASLVAEKVEAHAYTEPKLAANHPGFALQGEYTKGDKALQIIAMKDGQFHISGYQGGLPGAGWNRTAITRQTTDAAGVKTATAGFDRIERTSPTLGEAAPEGAVVLFGDNGEPNDFKGGEVSDYGLLKENCVTNTQFKDFHLHMEFRLPFKPDVAPGNQDRGNSGLYIFNNYEVQIIDSFGLDYDGSAWPEGTLPSDPKQWCGCLYKMKLADINASLPPLAWQTYDIDFTAPKKDSEGMRTANARITVRHNGILIHDDVELKTGTGAGAKRNQLTEGPLHIQGHGNPVRFKNIWVIKK